MVVLLLAAALFSFTSMAAVRTPGIFIDDVPIYTAEFPPLMENGRVLLPLRVIAPSLGAATGWDGALRQVMVTRGSDCIVLQPGSKTVQVNGQSFTLEVAPRIVNRRVYVPARFLAETLGAQVRWDPLASSITITSAAASGSGNDTGKGSTDNGNAKTFKENLPVVGSYENLKMLLQAREDLFYGYQRMMLPEVAPREEQSFSEDRAKKEAPAGAGEKVPAPSPDSAPAPAPAGTPGDDFSATNIQVEGVDEGDIVKTDGAYIYQVNKRRVVIARAYPPEQLEISTMIAFADAGFYPQELYVDGNLLIVIGNANRVVPGIRDDSSPDARKKAAIYPPPPFFSQTVKTIIYDISDKKAPQQLREIEMEGSYLASRKTGSALYLVSNKYLDYYYIMEQEKMGETAAAVTPSFRDTAGKDTFTPVSYAEIRYFPGFMQTNYLIIAGINLDRMDEQAQVHTFLGAGETIYASRDNLFVAVSTYENVGPRRGLQPGGAVIAPDLPDSVPAAVAPDPDLMPMPMPAPPPEPPAESTHIYKFALDRGRINYTARGEVPGRVLNQFSIDEHKGYFRIATTSGEMWGGGQNSSNNLHILDASLLPAGKVENIAPGERIYSVRFTGDKGYMVTFRTVDPLFVLDLSEPSNPRVLGALKIPGYSNYLHPYDENHLLGIGRETAELPQKDRFGNVIGSIVVDLGIKMTIFDVSDVHNPVEKFTEIIGARGTDSPLLHNHRALLFNRERNLLAFPIAVTETRGSGSGTGTGTGTGTGRGDGGAAMPPEYGVFAFQGAYVYHIDLESGFTLRGRISHLEDEDYRKAGHYWYDSERSIERLLYIRNDLYTLSPGMIQVHDLSDLGRRGSLLIP